MWLSDVGYGIALVIKIMHNKDSSLVLSFHESNRRGRSSLGSHDFSDKPCVVICERISQRPNCYGVDYAIQRGFIRYNVHSVTKYVSKDVALVDYRDIKSILDDTMSGIFKSLQETYTNNDDTVLSVTRMDSGKLSFVSLGFATVNNICLLIDMFQYYTDKASRLAISDLASAILVELPIQRLRQIQDALVLKYSDSTNKLYRLITRRD